MKIMDKITNIFAIIEIMGVLAIFVPELCNFELTVRMAIMRVGFNVALLSCLVYSLISYIVDYYRNKK